MFDLAGTLCSLAALKSPFNLFLRDFIRSFGKDVVDDEAHQIEVKYAMGLMKSFQTVGQRDFYLHSELFAEAIKNFMDLVQVKNVQNEDLDYALKNQRELTINSIRVREGVHETLLALRDMNIKTAVVSNIDEDYFYPMLEKLQILDKIDVALSSEKAKSCKPDSKIFRMALELINSTNDIESEISADQTLFVGDTPFADIKGANLALMNSVLLKTGTMKPITNLSGDSKPDFTISKISQIPDICIQMSESK